MDRRRKASDGMSVIETRFLDQAHRRLDRLQDAYLEDRPGARGDLAIIRRAWPKPTGSDPEAARLVLAGITPFHAPRSLRDATWDAFGLYAIHQQSIHGQGMHEPGRTMGAMLARLIEEDPDCRTDIDRLLHARDTRQANLLCRPVIALMRVHRMPLDHARLAWDLHRWNDPRRRPKVIAEWSRADADA